MTSDAGYRAVEECQVGPVDTDPVRFPKDTALLDATLAARQRYLATGHC